MGMTEKADCPKCGARSIRDNPAYTRWASVIVGFLAVGWIVAAVVYFPDRLQTALWMGPILIAVSLYNFFRKKKFMCIKCGYKFELEKGTDDRPAE